MKQVLSYVLAISIAILAGCKKEYELPSVKAPSNAKIEITKALDLTFGFIAEAGYKSATLAATGGTATIKTNASAGSTSGDIVITFIAGSTTGAGSVTLTLVDNEDQSQTGTAVISIEAFPTISVTMNISSDTTWETGKIYILEGRITVLSGVTLTIQPGVIVKGREGSEANATALMKIGRASCRERV